MKQGLFAAALAALAAACTGEQAPSGAAAPPEEMTAPAIDHAAIAAAAVAAPGRPEEDRALDAARKPETALRFMRIEPGHAVFEIEAGSGWYTELLSAAAGETGSVVMQNPPGFLAFVGDDIKARFASGRLGNVRQSASTFDALEAADDSIDLVTWVQGPHELYYTPEDGAFLGDPFTAYAEIFRVLKRGGAFVAIDHSAAPGSPETTGHELHRIDPVIVIEMAEGAGLLLEEQNGFLANPEDSRDLNVFDPAIRGKTDQFALRFRKP